MKVLQVGSFFLTLLSLVGQVGGATVVADNLIYEPFQFSGFRDDIGFRHTVNGGFANTSAAQPFVAGASGKLKSIASLIRTWRGGDPLRVAIHEWTSNGPGTSLGHEEFPQGTFPTDYFNNPPTLLDMSDSGVFLEEAKTYGVVLTTATPVFATPRYSIHVMPPTIKSFGLPMWGSRNGVTYRETSISSVRPGSYELPIVVTVVPEPTALSLLLLIPLAACGIRRRIL